MEKRSCQNCREEFNVEPDDFAFYERIKVPPPSWCPHCRMMRRFLFRNERHLFRRKDDLSGKEIFSSFPADAPVKVYERDYWWSDSWDPTNYGRDYNFSRPFFSQFRELLYSVPIFSKSVINMVDSDYCDQAGWVKNSYLCFDGDQIENSAYLVKVEGIRDSFDLFEAMHDELCYDSAMIDDCFSAFFSVDCESCSNIWFSKDLGNCSYCFGCVNLRNKSYYIFNQPLSKEEYFLKIQEMNLGSHASLIKWRKKANEFWLRFPVKFMHAFQNTNVSGEHIQNSKNVHRSYSVHDGGNLKYSQMLWQKITDSYDYTNFGFDSSLIYEAVTCGLQSYGLKFCWECWQGCRDLEYSAYCNSSSNLFGCVGLRKKQYCILNKQYSREDYFALREKIIRHMKEMPYIDKQGKTYCYGEFFPPEFSPFAYNETIAQDFFPLNRQEAQKHGYFWREPEAGEFQISINAADLPDQVNDIADSVLNEIIKCAACSKPYRIIPMELAFYRRMTLPIPRFCPNCRFIERFKFINPPQFWHRKCECIGSEDSRRIYKNTASHFHGASPCPNEFETSYTKERQEIVYCEQCYNTEVVH